MAKKKVVVKEVVATVISKKELIDNIAEASEYTKEAVKDITTAAFEQIAKELAAGNSVAIHSFGTFKVTDTAERAGRNPSTGEAITIAASKRVSFKVSSSVKNAVKEA